MTFTISPPPYSYFIGCSQGGHQGLELAQRYPDAYDGLAAATPAVYWSQFFQAMLWAQMVMTEIEEYPRGCELGYLQGAVIKKCDADDGIEDDIILDPVKCQFDPFLSSGQGSPAATLEQI
jgi:feruloyl esterase